MHEVIFGQQLKKSNFNKNISFQNSLDSTINDVTNMFDPSPFQISFDSRRQASHGPRVQRRHVFVTQPNRDAQ